MYTLIVSDLKITLTVIGIEDSQKSYKNIICTII